jgi:O-acetyl-ADP-ribose deacetylase (regulator of RNase III)
MPMKIIRNDITKMSVDAIVNTSNTALKMGGGVSGAIFSAAGAQKLQKECDSIGKCNVGEAVLTKGYALTAKYIIHTVGPIWSGGSFNEATLLHNSYTKSLTLAWENKCESIAFPLISSGIYGYPKEQALQIAISSIGEFLIEHEMMVYLVVYDKKSYVMSEKHYSAIEKYIDDNYVEEHCIFEDRNNIKCYELNEVDNILCNDSPVNDSCAEMSVQKRKRSLIEIVNQLDESFSEMLLRLIDEKGMTDVEVYKRANIDRKLFSKIRSSKVYNPSKVTAIALAISLMLNLDETCDLLSKAGYTLSRSNKFDVIIEYFIEEGNYSIFEINQALFDFDQDSLGA